LYNKYILVICESVSTEILIHSTVDTTILQQTSLILKQKLSLERKEIERRILAGDKCFIAHQGDDCLGVLWGHSGNIFVKGAGKKLYLGLDGVYLYGVFTAPNFRGKNVFNSLIYTFFKYYKKRGVNRFFALVHPRNTAMLHLFKKIGFKQQSLLFFFRLFQIGILYERSYGNERNQLNLVVNQPMDCFVL
jgi:ribosomal protein S18 acetylase RimI-like enzyme